MAQSLFEHGQIRTTLAKAKNVRPFAEKLITLAKKARQGDLEARRRIERALTDRAIIAKENQTEYDDLSRAKRQKVLRARSGRRYHTGEPKGGMPFTAESVMHRLINDIAERFADRPGGYTRLIHLSKTRIGDGGELAIVQLVGGEETPGSLAKPEKTTRKRRADRRYAAAAKAIRGKGAAAGKPAASDPADAAQPQTDESSVEEKAKETPDAAQGGDET